MPTAFQSDDVGGFGKYCTHFSATNIPTTSDLSSIYGMTLVFSRKNQNSALHMETYM